MDLDPDTLNEVLDLQRVKIYLEYIVIFHKPVTQTLTVIKSAKLYYCVYYHDLYCTSTGSTIY